MPMFFTGANMSGLQEKSMRFVYMDEVWQYKDGMVEEARRRTHDRWNSRVIMVSQAGFEGDQLHIAEAESLRHEYHFTCPQCGEHQEYDWEQVRYEVTEMEGGGYDWQAIYSTVHYECTHSCLLYTSDAADE